jgi:hypothetical protein
MPLLKRTEACSHLANLCSYFKIGGWFFVLHRSRPLARRLNKVRSRSDLPLPPEGTDLVGSLHIPALRRMSGMRVRADLHRGAGKGSPLTRCGRFQATARSAGSWNGAASLLPGGAEKPCGGLVDSVSSERWGIQDPPCAPKLVQAARDAEAGLYSKITLVDLGIVPCGTHGMERPLVLKSE